MQIEFGKMRAASTALNVDSARASVSVVDGREKITWPATDNTLKAHYIYYHIF